VPGAFPRLTATTTVVLYFARRPDDYLSLYPRRDVIEFVPDRQVDVNGWDLGKALRLLLKGNAVVIEWHSSPFIYTGDLRFRDEALELARQVARPQAIARHYLHLGERQRRAYFADHRSVPFKKLFYAASDPWHCVGCAFIGEPRLLPCIFRRSRPKVICRANSKQSSMICSAARL
jgi:hypothetical protein